MDIDQSEKQLFLLEWVTGILLTSGWQPIERGSYREMILGSSPTAISIMNNIDGDTLVIRDDMILGYRYREVE